MPIVPKDRKTQTPPAPRAPLLGAVQRPPQVVAIVGRPNVGKSALFNRLTVSQTSIVEDTPGVTRDRVYGKCEWNGHTFTMVDTGGMVPEDQSGMLPQILAQARKAIDEADLVLFVVDVTAGIHPYDMDVAQILRQSHRPVMLIANKVDSILREADAAEFWSFALGEPWPVSAIHGLGTGEILDEIVQQLVSRAAPAATEGASADEVWGPDDATEEGGAIRVAIVGRPNVGKSSLTNLIVGETRSIVDEVPGTTRDSLDTRLAVGDRRYIFIDTAGLRRKARVDNDIEYYSTVRAVRSIRRCDVALLVVDAETGVLAQDQKVAGEIQEHRKATIIIVNKWDKVVDRPQGRDADHRRREFLESIAGEFDFLQFAPVLFTSALKGWAADRVFPLVDAAYEQYSRRVETSLLNRVVQDAVALRPPPSFKGKQLKVSYAYQASARPPRLVLRVNNPKLLHFSYKRYLENKLREAFGFEGTPLDIELLKK